MHAVLFHEFLGFLFVCEIIHTEKVVFNLVNTEKKKRKKGK